MLEILRRCTGERYALRLMIVALVITNLALLSQNRALRAESRFADTPRQGADLSHLSRPTGRPRLLYYLSPDCRYCSLQAPAWLALAQITADRVDTAAIYDRAADGIETYLAETGLARLVQLPVTGAHLDAAGLRPTPATVFVDEHGRVVRTWTGAWNERAIDEIASALDLSEPERAELAAHAPRLEE